MSARRAINLFAGAAHTATTLGAIAGEASCAELHLNTAKFNRALPDAVLRILATIRTMRGRRFHGYEFWLAKLSQLNADFISVGVVKVFISASEFRGRFSP